MTPLSEASVVERLIQARLVKGLTQEELGNLLGVSASKISRVEAGQRGLSIDELARWAQVLDLEADFLLWKPVRDKELGVTALLRTLDDDGIALVRALALALPTMSPPNRAMVLQLLDVLRQRPSR